MPSKSVLVLLTDDQAALVRTAIDTEAEVFGQANAIVRHDRIDDKLARLADLKAAVAEAPRAGPKIALSLSRTEAEELCEALFTEIGTARVAGHTREAAAMTSVRQVLQTALDLNGD